MNYYESTVWMYDFGSDQAVDNAGTGASSTWYGTEVDYAREIVGAKYFGENAQTGNTTAKFDVNVYSAAGTQAASLAFNTGTDHTANTHTDLTLSTTRANRIVAAGTMYTVGAIVTGTPGTMLHTNSKVVVQFAPVTYI